MVQFAPQSAVGTYSYAIGNMTGSPSIADGIPSLFLPDPGNFVDQNQNTITGEQPDSYVLSASVDSATDVSQSYAVGDILTPAVRAQ